MVQHVADCRSAGVLETMLFLELDVILGMNWLKFNHVRINCIDKLVSFNDFDANDELFMSAKQVDEFMKDEVEVFMILATTKAESEATIGELTMTCDFP